MATERPSAHPSSKGDRRSDRTWRETPRTSGEITRGDGEGRVVGNKEKWDDEEEEKKKKSGS